MPVSRVSFLIINMHFSQMFFHTSFNRRLFLSICGSDFCESEEHLRCNGVKVKKVKEAAEHDIEAGIHILCEIKKLMKTVVN